MLCSDGHCREKEYINMPYNSTQNKAYYNFITAYFSSSDTTIHEEPLYVNV